MSRWRAALVHLVASLPVFMLCYGVVRLCWYPHFYFQVAGGNRLIALLLGVGLVLGPLLTLSIFKSGKKGLKFDLWFIAFAQLAGLSYGMYVASAARPAYVVFTVDRFNVMAANTVVFSGAKSPFDRAGWSGPVLVAAQLPTSPDEQQRLVATALAGNGDLQNLARHYQAYEAATRQVLHRGKPLSDLLAKHSEARDEVDVFLAGAGKRESDVLFLPLVGAQQDMSAIVDKTNGALLGAVAVDPW